MLGKYNFNVFPLIQFIIPHQWMCVACFVCLPMMYWLLSILAYWFIEFDHESWYEQRNLCWHSEHDDEQMIHVLLWMYTVLVYILCRSHDGREWTYWMKFAFCHVICTCFVCDVNFVAMFIFPASPSSPCAWIHAHWLHMTRDSILLLASRSMRVFARAFIRQVVAR